MKKPEPPELLKLFRTVMEDPPMDEEPERAKSLRRLQDKSPKDFIAQMTGLERSYQAHLAQWQKTQVPAKTTMKKNGEIQTDEGSQRVIELAEQILKDIAEKSKGGA